MTFEVGQYLTRIGDKKRLIISLINVNIIAMTKMIDLILPNMINRNCGAIINVWSICDANPIQLLWLYSPPELTRIFCPELFILNTRIRDCNWKRFAGICCQKTWLMSCHSLFQMINDMFAQPLKQLGSKVKLMTIGLTNWLNFLRTASFRILTALIIIQSIVLEN